MACTTCLCEWLLGVLNVLIMLIGLVIAAIGAVLQAAAGSTFFSFLETSIKSILSNIKIVNDGSYVAQINFQAAFGSAAIVLIVVGLTIACIAFIGWCSNCCGGYKVLRILYSIVLGVLIVAQIIIVALFFSGTLDGLIKQQATNLLENEYVDIDDTSLPSIIWNIIMLKYQCCGINDYNDFMNAKKWRRSRNLIVDGQNQDFNLTSPVACCKTRGSFPDVTVVDDYCAINPSFNTSNWETGCWKTVYDDLNQYRPWGILIASGTIIVQAIIILIVVLIIKANSSKVAPV